MPCPKPIALLLATAPAMLLAHAAPSAAQAATAADAVLSAERQRFAAQVKSDVPALGGYIADDAVYIHASGARQTKAEYLADVAAGKSRYAAIDASEATAAINGDTAITHGLYALTFGDGHKITARYTGVYARRAGRWLVISWQSTPVAPAR